MIITFANQKGGVGKSTLAALFANYLVEHGKSVLVVDADAQRSISDRRKEDESLFGTEQLNYSVDYMELKDVESSGVLMNTLKGYLSKYPDRVVIMDLPGNVTDNYLTPIFVQSNYIVCPFNYGKLDIKSTYTFAKVIHRLKEIFYKEMNSVKLLFVPNKIDRTVGTREEMKEKIKDNECLSVLGVLCPQILQRAEIGRFNTVSLTPRQRSEVSTSFDYIADVIFNP